MTMPMRALFHRPAGGGCKGGRVPVARIDDMAQRIVRSLFAAGLVAHPPQRGPLDVVTDTLVAQRDEEEGAVLLRNEGVSCRFPHRAHRGHWRACRCGRDLGRRVQPGRSHRGEAVKGPGKKEWPGDPVYFPSSPLKAMRAEAPTRTSPMNPAPISPPPCMPRGRPMWRSCMQRSSPSRGWTRPACTLMPMPTR
ncbi:hypothetical protein RAA17_07285 [Komagataeibacter rhaeticus]|nr:hypothetical protein [Komagataeibacter rhaeticus]